MRVVDDHAATVRDHEIVNHRPESVSPRHGCAHVDAVFVQHRAAVAIEIAAGEETARRSNVQVDVVVRKTVMFGVWGFHEARRRIGENPFPLIGGEN
ncbi:hypothetical protein SDC9_142784 [bioreactor metagenome]|uniref:Uncharacterized protein n=1 Tax=bioreactor metagenome TaxID=1076179 RepID=A0A645E255_9ZZZZ